MDYKHNNRLKQHAPKAASSLRGAPAPRGDALASAERLGKNTISAVKSDSLSRSELYKLRSTSQSVLPNNARVQTCMKVPSYRVQMGIDKIKISKNESGRAFWSGLSSCGCLRGCPVCRDKVGRVRSQEVLQVLSGHAQKGGAALLVTYTCRHHINDDLKTLVDRLAVARRKFASWTIVKQLKQLLGYTNLISSPDLTYSQKNGWHPHFHDIWLISQASLRPGYFSQLQINEPKLAKKFSALYDKNGTIKLNAVKQMLALEWQKACVKSDLKPPTITRGFDIQWRDSDGACAAGRYISKWAFETTLSHKKQANKDSMTPFEILQILTNEEYDIKTHPRLGELWRDYVKAYSNRAIIYFGRGLKSEHCIEEIEDQEILDNAFDDVVTEVSPEEAKALEYYNYKGLILDIAENYPPDYVRLIISNVVEKYRNEQRDYKAYQANLRSLIRVDTQNALERLKYNFA